MIIRLVTMTFHPKNVPSFLILFEKNKEKIRAFDGCEELKLIQNKNNPQEISTLSHWTSVAKLNNYRKSSLFGEVWPETKKLFSSIPKATSFSILHEL